jgi:transcription initiation factor TFIIE subunit alpha
MLVKYPCLREDDLCSLLKFDKKVLRAKLATLKSDRFVQTKMKIETGLIFTVKYTYLKYM